MDVATFESGQRTIATADGAVAYAEFGDGPAAVFLHGLGTSGALWRHAMERLADTSRCIAVDLPGHGGTSVRDSFSLAATADMVADLCRELATGQIDLVGNDTGGAVAQVFAARHPELLRSLVLTNCDTEGNYPPPEFAPFVELAQNGQIAPLVLAVTADPSAWRTSPVADGYEDPAGIPDDALRAYFTAIGGTQEAARYFELIMASLDPAELAAAGPALRSLDVPVLLVWGTGYPPFDVKWAYRLRDQMPAVREVIEIDGAKLLFPEERPEALVTALRRHWGR
jgi:pimeloyl-ACP methyl ester carboxylesterase